MDLEIHSKKRVEEKYGSVLYYINDPKENFQEETLKKNQIRDKFSNYYKIYLGRDHVMYSDICDEFKNNYSTHISGNVYYLNTIPTEYNEEKFINKDEFLRFLLFIKNYMDNRNLWVDHERDKYDQIEDSFYLPNYMWLCKTIIFIFELDKDDEIFITCF